MSVNKLWLQDEQFARSIERLIDRETLIDLLGIVIYEANRSSKLEDAGFADQANSVECLFDYVLDALHVTAESETFSREPFRKLFYNDYWLEHQLLSLQHVLLGLEQLRDTIENDRKTSSKNAEVQRASLHVISTNH